ncbi:hypothetical protein HRbin22_01169 [Candidatus Thermoflexus japonica]|uniref:Amidohydrolase-related domain-containing protein n=1 Tax=Candidatus Thermoflexus japonica TaxID=2035417 RepID=A0A2H5Y651_9CHLR|nr:hypothetical protein HRbin22_01169 [Candidatus Thermoflexus japonica]
MVVDIHAHILVEELTQSAAPEEIWRPLVTRAHGEERIEIGGRPLTSVRQPFVDLDAILQVQEARGIQITVLSPWIALLREEADANEALRVARCLNEALARRVQQYPHRLRAFGAIPLNDPEQAARELELLMQEPGMVGVEIPARVHGDSLGHERFDPLWAAAEAIGAFVFIHPTARSDAFPGLQDYYLWNAVGNPLETTITAAQIVMTGVLERHPRLRILLAHGGGALLHLKGRLQHAWHQRPEARQRLREPPEASIHRFYFDTVTHDPNILRALIDFAGTDQVLMGSDYPFDMGLEEPVEFVRSLRLPPEQEAKILGGNAARLFNLEG